MISKSKSKLNLIPIPVFLIIGLMISSAVFGALVLWFAFPPVVHNITVEGAGYQTYPNYGNYTGKIGTSSLGNATLLDAAAGYTTKVFKNAILLSLEPVDLAGPLQLKIVCTTSSTAFTMTCDSWFVQVRNDQTIVYWSLGAYDSHFSAIPVNVNGGTQTVTLTENQLETYMDWGVINPSDEPQGKNGLLLVFTFTQVKDLGGVHSFDIQISLLASDV